jgi:hypothetical protein
MHLSAGVMPGISLKNQEYTPGTSGAGLGLERISSREYMEIG